MAGIRLFQYPAKVFFQQPQIILCFCDVFMSKITRQKRKGRVQVKAFFLHLLQCPDTERMAYVMQALPSSP